MQDHQSLQPSESGTTRSFGPETSVRAGALTRSPLVMVETAFLASTSGLIWLINYYFPLGLLWRILFPMPIALAYMRWGKRAAWMTALVTGLLLSVLMGPPLSLQFFAPYGFLGILLGSLWKCRASWLVSIGWGTLITSLGIGFKIVLASLLVGENLWFYLIAQLTNLAEWLFVKLGLLAQPSLLVVQGIAVATIIINAILYLLVVHLAAWLLFERLGNPVPPPPVWLQILLDHEEL